MNARLLFYIPVLLGLVISLGNASDNNIASEKMLFEKMQPREAQTVYEQEELVRIIPHEQITIHNDGDVQDLHAITETDGVREDQDIVLWETDVPIITDSDDQKAPALFEASNGYLWCAYEDYGDDHPYTFIRVKRSTNGGQSWHAKGGCYSTQYPFYLPDILVHGEYYYVVYSRDGGIWLFKRNINDSSDYDFICVDCSDGYDSWRPKICKDGNNDFYVAYQNSDNKARVKKSTNSGESWTLRLEYEDIYGEGIDIDCGYPGVWVVCISDNQMWQENSRIRYFRSSDGGNTWWHAYVCTVDQVAYPSIAVSHTDNTVVVVYNSKWSNSDHDIRYAYSQSIPPSWECETLDFNTDDSLYPWIDKGNASWCVVYWNEGWIYGWGRVTFPGGDWVDYQGPVNDQPNASDDDIPRIVSSSQSYCGQDYYGVWVQSGNGWDIYGDCGDPTPVTDYEEILAPNIMLSQSYPNPFNAQTTIRYALPEAADIEISFYNLLGQRVVTLFKGAQQAGEHTITWDATDFPSGVYFYKIVAGEFAETRKMVLLK